MVAVLSIIGLIKIPELICLLETLPITSLLIFWCFTAFCRFFWNRDVSILLIGLCYVMGMVLVLLKLCFLRLDLLWLALYVSPDFEALCETISLRGDLVPRCLADEST